MKQKYLFLQILFISWLQNEEKKESFDYIPPSLQTWRHVSFCGHATNVKNYFRRTRRNSNLWPHQSTSLLCEYPYYFPQHKYCFSFLSYKVVWWLSCKYLTSWDLCNAWGSGDHTTLSLTNMCFISPPKVSLLIIIHPHVWQWSNNPPHKQAEGAQQQKIILSFLDQKS